MSNTCKKCGCEDPIPSAPCPTSVGCPTPSKCEETFSTECLTYTGDDLMCGNVTIVNKDEPINTVLESIVNAICAIKNNNSFDVTILESPGTPGTGRLPGPVATFPRTRQRDTEGPGQRSEKEITG